MHTRLPGWVTNDRFTASAPCPLLPQERPDRCFALSDAEGQQRSFADKCVAPVTCISALIG